jgi:hypothetical protein
MDNNFVIEALLETCCKYDRWMSAEKWVEIVCRLYNAGVEVAFNGNKLTHVISHNKVLNSTPLERVEKSWEKKKSRKG